MSEREELAKILMSDAVMRTSAMGRDYALVEADAILAAGFHKAHPEGEANRVAFWQEQSDLWKQLAYAERAKVARRGWLGDHRRTGGRRMTMICRIFGHKFDYRISWVWGSVTYRCSRCEWEFES